jgi:hypothetical protein
LESPHLADGEGYPMLKVEGCRMQKVWDTGSKKSLILRVSGRQGKAVIRKKRDQEAT